MDFLSINLEEKQSAIADAIIARENEIFSYQLNIDNYTAILESMSDLTEEWPSQISAYKNLVPNTIASHVPVDLLDLVNEYMYRDRIKFLLKTEKIEQSKSMRVLQALKSQLPQDKITELVAVAKDKMIIQRQKALG